MNRRPEPRRIVLDGEPAVALTPQEYDRLTLARRQLGSQSSRMSGMNRDLAQATHLLEDARSALCVAAGTDGDCPAGPSEQESGHLCCRIRALLDSPRFPAVARSAVPADDSAKSRGGNGHR
ncbi:hypothetical protein [Streptomyces sp. NPDC088794]|uniref:hypothetical protein n=1 Tax=Streptomyces sp. NPDC088794 TaxID=3365902 RepID=UPI0038025570